MIGNSSADEWRKLKKKLLALGLLHSIRVKTIIPLPVPIPVPVVVRKVSTPIVLPPKRLPYLVPKPVPYYQIIPNFVPIYPKEEIPAKKSYTQDSHTSAQSSQPYSDGHNEDQWPQPSAHEDFMSGTDGLLDNDNFFKPLFNEDIDYQQEKHHSSRDRHRSQDRYQSQDRYRPQEDNRYQSPDTGFEPLDGYYIRNKPKPRDRHHFRQDNRHPDQQRYHQSDRHYHSSDQMIPQSSYANEDTYEINGYHERLPHNNRHTTDHRISSKTNKKYRRPSPEEIRDLQEFLDAVNTDEDLMMLSSAPKTKPGSVDNHHNRSPIDNRWSPIGTAMANNTGDSLAISNHQMNVQSMPVNSVNEPTVPVIAMTTGGNDRREVTTSAPDAKQFVKRVKVGEIRLKPQQFRAFLAKQGLDLA